MTKTKTAFTIMCVIAASAVAVTIGTNNVFAVGITQHWEDPAAQQALDHAGGIANDNAKPIVCGPYDPPLTPPPECVIPVPP